MRIASRNKVSSASRDSFLRCYFILFEDGMHPESIAHVAIRIANHLRNAGPTSERRPLAMQILCPPPIPNPPHVSGEAQPGHAEKRVVHVQHVPQPAGYPAVLVILTIQYELFQPGRVYPSHPTNDGQCQEYPPAVANVGLLNGS